MNAKITTAAVVTLSLFCLILILIFRDELVPIIKFGAVAIVGVALVGGVVLAGVWIYIAVEHALTKRLERKKSQFVQYQDGFGMVYLHDVISGMIENLTVYPGSHRNGHWEDPNPVAAAGWHVVMGKRHSESPVAYLQQPQQPQLDLLTIMTQPTQSYAFIGGQQVGKTYQARRVASHWSQRGVKPLVIGPKWDKGEWDDCHKVGGEYDFNKVMGGMNAVKKLAEQRHTDTKRGHKDHPIQPVFFDDWTAIRAKLDKEAEEFIVDATTLYASVNIILYFIIHLDTANAWGVGKIGAALKNNFVKLFIEPGFNEAGIIDRSKNIGYVQMPGQSNKDRQQVPLFGEYALQPVTVQPDLVIHKATDKELEVIRLWQSGEHDEGKIARMVYGSGGRQLELARNAIDKFCR